MHKNTMIIIAVLSVLMLAMPAQAAGLFCPNPTENDQDNKDVARKYFQMGLGYSEQADHRKCIEAFECVLKLIPYSTSARYQLAKALDDGGQYTRARKEYKLFLTTADKADPLRVKVQERLAAIETLADKPLPPEAGEVAVEKMKEDLREELNRKLAELQKANKAADELEKEKARLQEEYRKKEAEKLAELNEKIRKLDAKEPSGKQDPVKAPAEGTPRKSFARNMLLGTLGVFLPDGDLVVEEPEFSKMVFYRFKLSVAYGLSYLRFLDRENAVGVSYTYTYMITEAEYFPDGGKKTSSFDRFCLQATYSWFPFEFGKRNRVLLQAAGGLSYFSMKQQYWDPAHPNDPIYIQVREYSFLSSRIQGAAGWLFDLTKSLHAGLLVSLGMEWHKDLNTFLFGFFGFVGFSF